MVRNVTDGRERRPVRRWLPALALGAVGGLQLLLGHPLRAQITWLLAAVVALLIAMGVDVAGTIGRVVTKVVHWASVALAGLVYLTALVPAWLWTKVRRRDPFAASGGWQPVDGPPGARPRSLGSGSLEAPVPRRPAGRLAWAVGVVVLVLLADLAAGTVVAGFADEPPALQPGPNLAERGRDPRADGPALAGAPWAAGMLEEAQQIPGSYWPFTEQRPRDYVGKYVTIDGWERQSYEPALPDDRPAPTVWFLGSSTTFGEGQRDEHTIASAVARLAEDAGVPVQVANYGQRGWIHFQEMLLYEQLLASEDPPDLSVFIDGANEVAGQVILEETVPTHLFTEQYAQALAGTPVEASLTQVPDQPTTADRLWSAYADRSLLARAGRWLAGTSPAGASPQRLGQGDDPFAATETGVRALEVYERSRALSMALSEAHDVEPLFVWQPFEVTTPSLTYIEANLGPPTVDLSGVFDGHEEVYIDAVHTNEQGAALMAEAIWESLEPGVQAWYAER